MALRYSGLHRHDERGKCIDPPTKSAPLELQFNGQYITITRCPYKDVPGWAWEAVRFAEAAEQGHWPVGGGLLDQSAWFWSAIQFVWSEIAHWKNKALSNG